MILYEGPSELDGAPIVAVATVGSRNPKTGDMVQVWIMRADVAPHEAVKDGRDVSICGMCPQRHYLGGACYVTPFQAPLSVWKRYAAGGYADPAWLRRVERAIETTPVRLGAYGDPAAVPFHVWEALLARGCGRWTGYTHQWRTCPEAYRGIVMASCDSVAEAGEARARGWRYFLVTSGSVEASWLPMRTIECPSDARGMSCERCGACDGTRADSREVRAASVAIQVHGARARRFPQLQVLQ